MALQLVCHKEARSSGTDAHNAYMALCMDGAPPAMLSICLWARCRRDDEVRHCVLGIKQKSH